MRHYDLYTAVLLGHLIVVRVKLRGGCAWSQFLTILFPSSLGP